MKFEKIFTPQEATKTLPLVKGIVKDILEKGKELRALLEKSKEEDPPKKAYVLKSEIDLLMGELENIGCFFKDWNFEIGLVDFPAVIDRQTVFLCWRSDEENLRWFHPVETGFAGRIPIPQELFI